MTVSQPSLANFKDSHLLQAWDLILKNGRTKKKAELLVQVSLRSQSQAPVGKEWPLRLEKGMSMDIHLRTVNPRFPGPAKWPASSPWKIGESPLLEDDAAVSDKTRQCLPYKGAAPSSLLAIGHN